MRQRTPAVGERSPDPPSGRPRTIGVASALAAALTWLLQAGAGRILGPEAYAAFMVVWGFVFLEIGLLLGLQQEVTRAVAADTRHRYDPDGVGPRVYPMGVGLGVGTVGAIVCVVGSPVWGERLFGSGWLPIVLATAFGFLAFALYNVMNGVVAGRQHWTDYSASIVVDSVLRIGLVIPVMLAGAGLVGQAWALNGAAFAWVLLLGRQGFREAFRTRVVGTRSAMTSGAVHAMVATACSAVMIAGFPVLLQVTAREPLGPEAGVLLAAVIATRAPLLLPLNAFQAVVLTRFVLSRDHIMGTLGRFLAVVGAVTASGVLAGYLVGPWLLRLLYGDAFRISSELIAGLVLAAGLIAMQTLTGTAVMAFDRHRVFAASWLLSAGVAVVVLSTGLTVGTRAALALNLGPIAGLVVNLCALGGRRRVRVAAAEG